MNAFLGLSLVVFVARARLIERIPERARFDWAGAFGEGFSAPRDSAFDYSFRPLALSLLATPFLLRGALACIELVSSTSAISSVVPAVAILVGSCFAYATIIPLFPRSNAAA